MSERSDCDSPGWCRDQMDIGLDLIRTAMNALFGGYSNDLASVASTIEQGMKFMEPGRSLLDRMNAANVERLIVRRSK